MTSIDHMVYTQPEMNPQVTGDLTHVRFCKSTIFMDQFSEYCYTHLMRGTSAEETLRSKEAYEHLKATHGASVCDYRADNGRFEETQFKEAD